MCVRPSFALRFGVFAHVGGNFNNGANCGLWYWNFNNDSSNANFNIGCRVFIFEIFVKKYRGVVKNASKLSSRIRYKTGEICN